MNDDEPDDEEDQYEPPRHFGDTDMGQCIGMAIVILALGCAWWLFLHA